MNPLRHARRLGVERGLLGSSRFWLAIGVLAWLLRAAQWAWRPSPERVFSGALQVGETISITQLPTPPSRRQRRRSARAARRSA